MSVLGIEILPLFQISGTPLTYSLTHLKYTKNMIPSWIPSKKKWQQALTFYPRDRDSVIFFIKVTHHIQHVLWYPNPWFPKSKSTKIASRVYFVYQISNHATITINPIPGIRNLCFKRVFWQKIRASSDVKITWSKESTHWNQIPRISLESSTWRPDPRDRKCIVAFCIKFKFLTHVSSVFAIQSQGSRLH